MHFAIFPLHLSKVLHLPRKSDARSYEVLRLSHKIISANLKIWCSSMQPLSGNQRPDLLTALTNMSLALRPLPDPLHMSHACHRFWNCYTTLMLCSLLTRCTIPCACHAKRHLNVQKCSVPPLFSALLTSTCCFAPQRRTLLNISTSKRLRGCCVLYIWTWKCASCHNGMHFFGIPTSKKFRSWCALYILNWKCALRHNGVQLFISHLATWPRTRRFSEPAFRPSGATNHWKNTAFCDFPTFSRTWTFFLLRLSLFWSSFFFSSFLFFSLLFSSFLFSSLTLSISASMNMSGNMSDIYIYISDTPFFCR